MQPLSWYLRRLVAMSTVEAANRARGAARDTVDALRVRAGWTPRPPASLFNDGVPRFRLSDVAVGEWASARPGSPQAVWRDRLLRAAEDIAAHRLSFFDLREHDLGDAIEWNRDPQSGRRAPMGFARWIDYRDHSVVGDCKLVWEPNRHHQLTVLGRAYRATGDERYADAVVDQLESWLDACPFCRGINWRSTLELGIRIINWTWALDLIRESGRPERALRSRLLASLYQHVWEIARRYSSGSSANNHLVGEAAGVFVATTCLPGLDPGGRLHRESREILAREIVRQSHEDGGTREQAIGYQLFLLQFYLVVDAVARASGEPMPPAFESRLERMLEFVKILAEGGETLPAFGDADDGYVLDLGGRSEDWRSWLGVGVIRFHRTDMASQAAAGESIRWLLGQQAWARLAELRARAGCQPLASRALAHSGYYLLQSGRRDAGDGVSVVFDCGELGFGSIAAHGHADALSFSLRAFGCDILVDPGTFDYFTCPEWRRYFRSTRAHNTVQIDGLDQSRMEGPFLWGHRARARCRDWAPTRGGGRVVGEHDGYCRLADPVTHRRTLELAGSPPVLTITDEVIASAPHDVAVFFHASEVADTIATGPRSFEIRVEGGVAHLTLDDRFEVERRQGSLEPLGGWVSRGYHRRAPSTSIVGRARSHGSQVFICRVELHPGGGRWMTRPSRVATCGPGDS
jgi:uncharacterized heparinase superfamily protein